MTRFSCRFTTGLALTGLLLMFALTAASQDEPKPHAARLASVAGAVRLVQGGQLLADQALANTPVFDGTEVSTGDDGQAELQFEDGSFLRLPPMSAVMLSAVSTPDGGAKSRVEHGLAYFEAQASKNGFEVRVADATVTLSGFTVLRVRAEEGPAELAVVSGKAFVNRAGGAPTEMHGSQSLSLGSEPGQAEVAESVAPDSWDNWNQDRDEAMNSEAAESTGQEAAMADSRNPAWKDLDANGNWYDVPGRGMVWSPYEASEAGWDPYGFGHWMWMPRYGYIWVSGYRWGYEPFSCGGWGYFDFGWGWMAGECSPWWGGGIWFSNILYGPSGYRPPHRPIGGPITDPKPPMHSGPRYPVVPVGTAPRAPFGGSGRDRSTAVIEGGHRLEPIHGSRPMPTSGAMPGGFGFSTPRTSTGSVNGTGNGGSQGGQHGWTPSRPSGGTPAPVHSGGGGGGAPVRPSSGGGGTGGSPHVSSGGGGGGGGGGGSGSHSSGGSGHK